MGGNNDNDNNENNNKDNNGDKGNNDDDDYQQQQDDYAYVQQDEHEPATVGFSNYVPTTTDPEPWILIGTSLICLSLFVLSTIFLSCRRRRRMRRKRKLLQQEQEHQQQSAPPYHIFKKKRKSKKKRRHSSHSNSSSQKKDPYQAVATEDCKDKDVTRFCFASKQQGSCGSTQEQFIPKKRPTGKRLMGWTAIATEIHSTETVLDPDDLDDQQQQKPDMLEQDLFERGGPMHRFKKHLRLSTKSSSKAKSLLPRTTTKLASATLPLDKAIQQAAPVAPATSSVAVGSSNKDPDGYKEMGRGDKDDSNPKLPATEDDPLSQLMEATDDYSLMREGMSRHKKMGLCPYLLSLFTFDRESRKIFKLAIPYTISALIESIFHLMIMGLVGRELGTGSLTAYLVVSNAFEIATILLTGLLSSLTTVCSQASGSEQYVLAGQFVQIGVLLYLICFLPQAYFWWFYVHDGMEYFGFEEEICAEAQEYSRVYFILSCLEVFYNGFSHLLEVTDFERFVTASGCLHSAASFGVACMLLLTEEVPFIEGPATLFLLGFLEIGVTLLFAFFNFFYMICFHGDWWKSYAPGLFGKLGLFHWDTVRFFLKASAPLSFGYVLSYGEWEALFVLAGQLGPAELAVWGILGEFWSSMETLTYAWGDAAEVRCAKLLGAGHGRRARRSTHQGMLMAFIAALLVSLFVLLYTPELPGWFTNDEILQELLEKLLPLVAVGNIALSLGTSSFQLVGAQARYSLATAIQFFGSWLVTLPLSLIAVFILKWNMQALVAAVVIGCMVSGSLNFVVLCSTNWHKRAAKIVAKNEKLAAIDELTDDSSSDSDFEWHEGRKVAEF